MPRKRETYQIKGHHPFIGWMDEEISLQYLTETELALKAGLGASTVSDWRKGNTPNIANFDAALQALGYRLAIVDMHENTVEA